MKLEKFEHEIMMNPDGINFNMYVDAMIKRDEAKSLEQLYKIQHTLLSFLIKDFRIVHRKFRDANDYKSLLEEEVSRQRTLTQVVNSIDDLQIATLDQLGAYYNAAPIYRKLAMAMTVDYMNQSGFADLETRVTKGGKESLSPSLRRRYHALDSLFKHIPEYINSVGGNESHQFYSDIVARISLSEKKNYYVIAKDFFNDFKNTSLKNPTFDHLPSGICGAIRLPHFLKGDAGSYYMREVLFSTMLNVGYNREDTDKVLDGEASVSDIAPAPSTRQVIFAWRDHLPAVPSVSFLNMVESFPGQTLEDSWQRSCEASKNKDYPEGDSDLPDEYYADLKKLFINLLVYIKSGKPDIRPFRNHIRYNSVTHEPHTQFANLVEEEVNLVGYNWKKLPNYRDEDWYSRPHFGWRWCGEGKTELSYSFIKGSRKAWKVGEDGSNQGESELIERGDR